MNQGYYGPLKDSKHGLKDHKCSLTHINQARAIHPSSRNHSKTKVQILDLSTRETIATPGEWKKDKKQETITEVRDSHGIKYTNRDSRDLHQHHDGPKVQWASGRHTQGLWVKTVTSTDSNMNIFATVVRFKPVIRDKVMIVLPAIWAFL